MRSPIRACHRVGLPPPEAPTKDGTTEPGEDKMISHISCAVYLTPEHLVGHTGTKVLVLFWLLMGLSTLGGCNKAKGQRGSGSLIEIRREGRLCAVKYLRHLDSDGNVVITLNTKAGLYYYFLRDGERVVNYRIDDSGLFVGGRCVGMDFRKAQADVGVDVLAGSLDCAIVGWKSIEKVPSKCTPRVIIVADQIPVAAASEILRRFPSTEYFIFSDVGGCDYPTLAKLLSSAARREIFIMLTIEEVRGQVRSEMPEACEKTRLKGLGISCRRKLPTGIVALAAKYCRSIESLSVGQVRISKRDVEAFERLHKLKDLDIVASVSDPSFWLHPEYFKRLKQFGSYSFGTLNKVVRFSRSLDELEVLEVAGIPAGIPQGEETGDLVRYCGNRSLRALFLAGGIRIKAIEDLGELSRLESLRLRREAGSGGVDIAQALQRLESTALRELCLEGELLTEELVSTLARIPELQLLRLVDTEILEPRALVELGQLKKLRYLDISIKPSRDARMRRIVERNLRQLQTIARFQIVEKTKR